MQEEPKFKQLTLPLPWSLSYSPEEYVLSDCNRYAFEWLEKWPLRIHENFACLVGSKGSGKSHLAGIWAKRVGADIFNARSGVFEKWFDISENTSNNKFFVLDDADLIVDDVLLFYIYNTIKERDAYLLLTALNPPIRWNLQLADVRSRFLSICVLNINKPDEKAMDGIIRQMLKQRGLEAKDNVVSYLLNNSERSYASINSLINKIDGMVNKHNKLSVNLLKTMINSQ